MLGKTKPKAAKDEVEVEVKADESTQYERDLDMKIGRAEAVLDAALEALTSIKAQIARGRAAK